MPYDKEFEVSHRETYFNDLVSNDIKSEKSKIVKPLFIVSLACLLGSFFFNGCYSNNVISGLMTSETIDSALLDYDIEYRIKASNYDYTSKLYELNNFRNVFELDIIQESINVSSDYYYNGLKIIPVEIDGFGYFPLNDDYFRKYPYKNDIPYLELMNKYFITHMEDDFLGYNFYYYEAQPYTEAMAFEITQETYNVMMNVYNSYVNYDNVADYRAYLQENTSGDEWWVPIRNAFVVLTAPLTWTYNLLYDLGVFMNFVINW